MKLYQDISSSHLILKITRTKLETPSGSRRAIFENQGVFYKKTGIKTTVLNNVFNETSIYYI